MYCYREDLLNCDGSLFDEDVLDLVNSFSFFDINMSAMSYFVYFVTCTMSNKSFSLRAYVVFSYINFINDFIAYY